MATVVSELVEHVVELAQSGAVAHSLVVVVELPQEIQHAIKAAEKLNLQEGLFFELLRLTGDLLCQLVDEVGDVFQSQAVLKILQLHLREQYEQLDLVLSLAFVDNIEWQRPYSSLSRNSCAV